MNKIRTIMVWLCIAFTLTLAAQNSNNTTILSIHQEDFNLLNASLISTGILMDRAMPIIPFNDSVKYSKGKFKHLEDGLRPLFVF